MGGQKELTPAVPKPAIVWFRQDLRLTDNPALQAAVQQGGPVIPVYIWASEEAAAWSPGSASKWWLHQSLGHLGQALAALGSRLIVRRGASLECLQSLIRQTGAAAVFWNRCYEPAMLARDRHIATALAGQGVKADGYPGALLFEPETLRNKSGKPFQVFTPFWRTCLALGEPPEPLPAPRQLTAPSHWPDSLSLSALALEPKNNWPSGLRAAWQPGSANAEKAVQRFLNRALAAYSEQRNRPDCEGTSRLSPYLHFGEISPRQLWHGLRRHALSNGLPEKSWRTSQFLAEVGWREFAHHLLFHFPHTPTEPLRPQFKHFPWRENGEWLAAWQRGCTGYPLVDAGMRELWQTGWMHNRVRMVVASFLVKDLLLDWQAGARWFWDTLVDADLANNTLGWQWTAGCGADAAPYFRIFNPASQGEKFDPHGDYIRKYVPELARLPDAWIHRPWEAPPELLARAAIDLGKDYPRPIVSHTIAREVALEAYQKIR
ncbi:MAG: deoxyribodipyrimidine photo-lyase [Verrucomicrobiota bacterium]